MREAKGLRALPRGGPSVGTVASDPGCGSGFSFRNEMLVWVRDARLDPTLAD
jgi:hypothetical protein